MIISDTQTRSAMERVERPNVASIMWDAAADAGDRTAIVERGSATPYGALCRHTGAVCGALRAMGIRPGDRVGVLLDRGADAIACYFGILAAGGVAVLINEKLRPRQIEHILGHSGAAALVSSQAVLARQPRAIESANPIVDLQSFDRTLDAVPCARVGADPAQIVYTSGSTGLPKGVVFTHDNLRRAGQAVVSYLGVSGEDRIASLLPLSSVYGLNQLLCAVTTRAALVIELSTLPDQIDSALRARAVTIVAAVPPLWLQLLRTPRFAAEPLPALRIMQNAGGHLPVDAVRRLRTAQPRARLFLQYGLTEAFRSTYLDPGEVDRFPDSIGRAMPGAEILVVREDLVPCAPGEVGELVQRGPTVAAGYWNDDEATTRVFRPHPLRPAGMPAHERVVFSGDLVRQDAQGRLYFVGRRDRMIKTLGYRVAPDEVADVLLASGDVAECVIAGEADGNRGERIVAYIVLSPSGSLERLRAFCRQELPRHLQPSRYDVRDELPRLPGGKYDLVALCQQSPFATASAALPGAAAPGERSAPGPSEESVATSDPPLMTALLAGDPGELRPPPQLQ